MSSMRFGADAVGHEPAAHLADERAHARHAEHGGGGHGGHAVVHGIGDHVGRWAPSEPRSTRSG